MISGVIITLNEEDHIEECLQSLHKFCDDIVVIDAGSTYKTRAIARRLGARVFVLPWKGYGYARNMGAKRAKNSWIFSIDADERVTDTLADSIMSRTLEINQVYKCKRSTRYCGKWIRFGIWNPEWKTRLYHRQESQWNDRLVHETLSSKTKLSHIHLHGNLLHLAYPNHQMLEKKLSQYALLSARQWMQEEYNPGIVKRTLGPAYHFTRGYLLKLGFLDGMHGLNIALAYFRYNQQKYRHYTKLSDESNRIFSQTNVESHPPNTDSEHYKL